MTTIGQFHTKEQESDAVPAQKAWQELRRAKGYLQMILDNSRVLIITTDTGGAIVEFNKEAERLLEYKKDEVVGKNVLMLYQNPHQRGITVEKRPQDEIWEARDREVVLKSKSGVLYHVDLTLSTLVDEDGRIIGTVGVGRDVSEQNMLQFKLLQSEKLAGLGTLASGIAHEINNPLAGILGMAEAARDEDDPELVKSYINDVIQYALHASSIVKELSAYSRSAQNEASTAVDLSQVMEASLKMARHSAPFKEIVTDSSLEHGSIVMANEGELRQVFVNLMVNAIHAMGSSGTLSIKCWREGTFVCASVGDTGCGIPPGHMSQIFDPFFTTKPPGKGTGLGLYVIYKIVTRCRGSIDVESEEGRGTIFYLKFPQAIENHQAQGT